jgi:phosphohistidine phosphatase
VKEFVEMKTLYLVRHAKSSWEDSTLSDRERPLDPRGERDVAKMSKRWSHRHSKPDLILSSPAVRTLATATVLAKGLGHKLNRIVVDDRLYAASASALIAVIEAFDDKLERVMLVGHNPGLADLVQHFSNEIIGMPTCAIAEFTFDVKRWSGVGRAKPARSTFDSPKQLSG